MSAPNSRSAQKRETLRKYFGYASFRDGQEALIDAQLDGRDVLGVMPTGGGKSLCYQLPALILDGVALVISPLISLMKDQVMALQNIGVDAACLNSSLSAEQSRSVYQDLADGRCKILYVAPERLLSAEFVAAARNLNLSLVAVDEAHCISQWGQDFRPSYLKIPEFLKKLPRRPPLSAFTATATPRVQEDIVESLALREPLRVVTGFDRPNLRFEVLAPRSKMQTLLTLLSERRGRSGIIYCSTRREVEKLAGELAANGYSAAAYHAGLPAEVRRQNQEDFVFDRREIMVATNAFGMGIDKSNVAFVIHYNMPKSLEEYYQEAGRAGRDGEPADCLLLFSAGDVRTAEYLIKNSERNEELSAEEQLDVVARDLERLKTIVDYCKATDCLRGRILDYFGQPHADRCENCGNCSAQFSALDITREAQMILSCVRRVEDALGYSVGASLVVQVLRGSSSARVRDLRLDSLSTYGLLRGRRRAEITELVDCLLSQGYLYRSPEFQTITTTKQANSVLFRGEKVILNKRLPTAAEQKRRTRKSTPAEPLPPGEDSLFEELRSLRYQIAKQEQIPAYMVFSNAALADMAARRPGSMAEFLEVSGVGSAKARRYGETFLAAIELYCRSHPAD